MRSGAGPGWREQTGQGVGAGGGGSPALPGPGPHPLAKLPAWAQGTLPGHVSSQSRLCWEPVPSLGLAPRLSRVATLVLKGSLPAVIQPGPVRAVSGKGSPSHPTLSTCPPPPAHPSRSPAPPSLSPPPAPRSRSACLALRPPSLAPGERPPLLSGNATVLQGHPPGDVARRSFRSFL